MASPGSYEPVRLVIGGGIGSGKSLVSRMLAELGAQVIEADRVGHRVLERGGAAFAAVAARWPSAVVDGRLDRSRLAAIVFDSPAELNALEQLTHPAIKAEIGAIAAAANGPVAVEIPVIADLVEGTWLRVFVDAPDVARFARAVDRGSERHDVERRMAAQPSRAEWIRWADRVIPNDGDIPALRERVEEMWNELTG